MCIRVKIFLNSFEPEGLFILKGFKIDQTELRYTFKNF